MTPAPRMILRGRWARAARRPTAGAAADPAPAEPPRGPVPATCTDGTDGVDTVGVRNRRGAGTGSGGGVGTGGGVGLGIEQSETVGVGTDGVETVGVGTDGVETVGVRHASTRADMGTVVGTVRAGLECG